MHTSRHTRLLCRVLAIVSLWLLALPVQAVRAETQGADRVNASATAGHPKRVTLNKQRFMTNRGVFVKAPGYGEATQGFIEWLNSQGIKASHIKGKGYGTIVFQRVPYIQGVEGNDGFSIQTKSKKITVYFTTPQALQHAINLLQSTLVVNEGVSYWRGGLIKDWGTMAMTRLAIVDIASVKRPVKEMEGAIRKQIPATKAKEVYVTFVNRDNWRMQAPSLERAEVTQGLYPSDGCYSRQDMLQIDQICRKNELRMIPTLELFSENSSFVNAFGHSVFSVEGMRFVRAAIEDCVEILRPKKICLGKLSDEVDVRYLQFVSGVAEMLEVELVIIEAD